MKTETVLVTPLRAAEYLKLNTANVPVRPSKVRYFAGILRRGEWVLVHQGIAISTERVILDGQHRLMAIVLTGIAAQIRVTTDADPKSWVAIDTNIPRPLAAVLGRPSREVETIRFLQNIAQGNGKKTVAECNQAYAVLGTATTKLFEYCPTPARVLTAAPIRAAAVYLIWSGKDADHVLRTYGAMANRRYGDMSTAAQAFVRQVDSNKIRSGSLDRLDFFARAMLALDPETVALTRLHVADTTKFTSIVRIKLQQALGIKAEATDAVSAKPFGQRGYRASSPDATECIQDAKELQKKYHSALTRRRHLKKSMTGRRYEKFFPNWEAFMAAVQASQ